MTLHSFGKWLAALWIAMVVGCGSEPPSDSIATDRNESREAGTAAPAPGPESGVVGIAQTAQEVARGVGELRESDSSGTNGTVFVFEEFHTSRVGQLQIGVMLLRLHDRHGLRTIGLEGALQRESPLDATWFHALGGPEVKRKREDVAVRMLAEGEISSAEFLALLYKDVEVRGLELKKEYDFQPPKEGNPVAEYLLGIAEKKLTQSTIRKINELVEKEKPKEALDLIKASDPWVQKRFALLEQTTVDTTDLVTLVREIQAEAGRLNVEVGPEARQGLARTLEFYETATQRSGTMTSYLRGLLAKEERKPAAMIIGAAHSKEVMDRLKGQGISYALLRPIALNPTFANLSSEEFERKNAGKWARTTNGTLGRILNGLRKPPPGIESATARGYASAYLAVMLVGEAVRNGERVPDDVRLKCSQLPDLEVDFESFSIHGFDVVFRVRVLGIDGTRMDVWARAGTVDSPEESTTVESRLLQAIADLGGGGRPPTDPPKDTQSTAGAEGPGDGKRGDAIIARIGAKSLAVFATDKAAALKVGNISS